VARPRKQIGEIGSIHRFRDGDGFWLARATVRRANGTTYKPQGRGKTKAAAEADLRARVDRDAKRTSDTLNDDPTISELIDLWARTDHASARLTESSRRMYERIRQLAGSLRVSEATTMRLEAVLFSIGTGAPSGFKQRKTVLNLIFTSAMRVKGHLKLNSGGLES